MIVKIQRWRNENYLDAARVIAQAEKDGTWILVGQTSLPIEVFESGLMAYEDGGLLLSSSGTTGTSRTCRLPFSMIKANAQWGGRLLKLDGSKEVVVSSSLQHTAGWNTLLIPALMYGAKVLLRPAFDAFEIVRLMSEGQPRVFHLSPLQAALVCRTKTWRNISAGADEIVVIGSTDVPPRLIREIVKKGFTVVSNYGLTEAGPYIFSKIIDSSNVQSHDLRSIGGLAPTVEHKLEPVQNTNLYSLFLRGPAVFDGYDLDKHLGWFETGDLFVRENEKLSFACRSVDLVQSAKSYVAPNLIEQEVLEFHSNIDEILVVPFILQSEITLKVFMVGRLKEGEDLAIRIRISDLTRISTNLIELVKVKRLLKTKSGKLIRSGRSSLI